MAVQVAVAHSPAVQDQALIQQRAVAVLRGLHLVQKVREQLDVKGIDPRLFCDEVGAVPVVRHGMVLFGYGDVRIRTTTDLASGSC